NDVIELSGQLGPCQGHADCQRGLICGENRCLLIIGCGPGPGEVLNDDEGCIYTSASKSGVGTSVECMSDNDCETSRYGENCILNVCTEQSRCVDDADCPEPQVCASATLCVVP